MSRKFSCGWDTENNYTLSTLVDICDDIYNLNYELKNCIRGSETNCHTMSDLAEYVRNLADSLSDVANSLENEDEDDCDCDCDCDCEDDENEF